MSMGAWVKPGYRKTPLGPRGGRLEAQEEMRPEPGPYRQNRGDKRVRAHSGGEGAGREGGTPGSGPGGPRGHPTAVAGGGEDARGMTGRVTSGEEDQGQGLRRWLWGSRA